MTEQELRRTAVIIPPTGRAVLCVWAAVPGLFAAPFVFWQSRFAGQLEGASRNGHGSSDGAAGCDTWGAVDFALRHAAMVGGGRV